MDLNRLQHFVVLAQTLHFGRAATALNMAQPALSRSIQLLEKGLAVRLFERTRRSVALTPAGQLFLDEALSILAQVQRAQQMAQRASSGEDAPLRVGFVGSAVYSVLPEAVRLFREQWPQVDLRLMERSNDEQVAALRRGELELGCLHRAAIDTFGLASRSIRRTGMVAAVREGTPLAKRARLSLQDLAELPFVLFPPGVAPHQHAEIVRACRASGFVPNVVCEARQIHTILSLVAAGLGVSLVSAFAQDRAFAGVRFVPVPEIDQQLVAELGIAWVPRSLSTPLRALIELVEVNAAAQS